MPVRVLLITVTLAMLTSGCVSEESGGSSAPEATTTTVETASWPLVARPQDDDPRTTETHMAALLEGTLVIDMDARCIWVDTPNRGIGGRKVAVVFPPGTVLRVGAPAEVVLSDGTVLHDDDPVAFGGGGINADYIKRIPYLQHLDVPETCSDISEGVFWQASSAVATVDSD